MNVSNDNPVLNNAYEEPKYYYESDINGNIDYMKINDRIISVYFDKHMYNTATIVNDFLNILKNNNVDYLFTNR